MRTPGNKFEDTKVRNTGKGCDSVVAWFTSPDSQSTGVNLISNVAQCEVKQQTVLKGDKTRLGQAFKHTVQTGGRVLARDHGKSAFDFNLTSNAVHQKPQSALISSMAPETKNAKHKTVVYHEFDFSLKPVRLEKNNGLSHLMSEIKEQDEASVNSEQAINLYDGQYALKQDVNDNDDLISSDNLVVSYTRLSSDMGSKSMSLTDTSTLSPQSESSIDKDHLLLSELDQSIEQLSQSSISVTHQDHHWPAPSKNPKVRHSNVAMLKLSVPQKDKNKDIERNLSRDLTPAISDIKIGSYQIMINPDQLWRRQSGAWLRNTLTSFNRHISYSIRSNSQIPQQDFANEQAGDSKENVPKSGNFVVVRAQSLQAKQVKSAQAGNFSYTSVIGSPKDAIYSFIVQIRAKDGFKSLRTFSNEAMIGTVIEGTTEVTFDGITYKLNTFDCFKLCKGCKYSIKNTSDTDCKIYIVSQQQQ
ncbi:hypothetical protein MIR68_000794 [Amoeboaphelidium protococcarum]|nr:hypothetical protein MIR68_000794 [Amoeboaphelidium protococcarum]